MNAIDIPLISREQGVVCDENQVIKWPEYMECYQILLSYQVPFHLRGGKNLFNPLFTSSSEKTRF